MKTALITAAVAIAIAAALTAAIPQAHADSPPARASQASDHASQTLHRYTLQLLRILSNPHANQYQRYHKAMTYCADAPEPLDAIAQIGAANDASTLDRALIALTEDLCADLDQRLAEARTVGLLVNESEAMPGYVLITGHLNNHVHLIDHLGRVAHSWQLGNHVSHARLLDNGNLLAEMNGGTEENKNIAEVDSDGNVVWRYSPPGFPHHDFLNMPNGNVLMVARMTGFITKQEAIAVGASPDLIPSMGMKIDYLIEVRPTGTDGGEIVWEWHAWDYIIQDFDPSKPNYGSPSEHPELIDINFLIETPEILSSNNRWDWLHANSLDYNPALNQIMLSPRNYSELWIIDRSASREETAARNSGNGNTPPPPRTNVLNHGRIDSAAKGGALLYRWGNPRAYGHGTTADQRLFWQHHAHWIAPGLPGAGNILVFNNGNEITAEQRRSYSSIDEIVPPVDGYGYRREPEAPYPPTEPAWTYAAETPTDFYSPWMGGAQRLPNGNTLITDSTSGNLFQVTPDGKTVWQYVYPMDGNTPLKQGDQPSPSEAAQDILNNAVYRAYWYAPDHPGLQNYDLTPGDPIELYE